MWLYQEREGSYLVLLKKRKIKIPFKNWDLELEIILPFVFISIAKYANVLLDILVSFINKAKYLLSKII